MWNYEKRLQYPVNITKPNAKIAQIIISQYGGPDGEAAASLRYLSQRYCMPNRKIAGVLTDIGVSVTKLPLFLFRRKNTAPFFSKAVFLLRITFTTRFISLRNQIFSVSLIAFFIFCFNCTHT